jgi:hypothetical protein
VSAALPFLVRGELPSQEKILGEDLRATSKTDKNPVSKNPQPDYNQGAQTDLLTLF